MGRISHDFLCSAFPQYLYIVDCVGLSGIVSMRFLLVRLLKQTQKPGTENFNAVAAMGGRND
jgi:hypothetical protein